MRLPGMDLPPVPTGPPKKPGTVEGVVSNSVTHAPVKKATVNLRNLRGQYSYVATTDAAGHFLFDSVEPDAAYMLTAACPGFSFQMPSGRSMFSLQPLAVAEEQHVTGAALQLSPLGVISGKVLDEDGDPIPSLIVRALQFDYQQGAKRLAQRGSDTTDDHGEYRIFDLQPGHVYIQAVARPAGPQASGRMHRDRPDEGFPATFYPAAADVTSATAADVTPGAEVTGIDFRVHKVRVYRIRGTAVDAQTQQPVHGAGISALPCASGSDRWGYQTSAGLQPDGAFDLRGLIPGPYCLTIQSNQGGKTSFGRQTVSVADQDVDGVVVAVSPSFALKGVVAAEGPPPESFKNIRVMLSPAEPYGGMYANAGVQEDGSFVLENVVPQAYDLQLSSPPAEGYYLKSIRLGDQDVSAGRIDAIAGATLTLTLASDSGQVAVSVRSASGDPAARIPVIAIPEGDFAARRDMFRTGFTDPNGNATISGLPPGDYQVLALENFGDMNFIQSPDFRKLFAHQGASLTVHANGRDTVSVKLITTEEIEQAKSKLP